MSDSARHAAFIIAETEFGVTPDDPVFNTVRHAGLTLGVQRGSLQSEELRSDRQISDFRLGAVSVAGDISTELSFASFDNMLEAVLCGTWATKATLEAATLSAAAADDSFNDSGNGFVTAGFEVGDLIEVEGFTGAVANNAQYKIVTVAAGKITVTNPDGTAAVNIVNDAAGEEVTIVSLESVLKAGTERRSFSILRHFTDQEDEPFHLFNGCEFNTLAISVSPTAIVSAAFGVVGREGIAPDAAAPDGATFVAPTTTAPLDAFTGELKSGATVVGEVTEFSINLANGLEMRNVVGSKFTLRPSIGRSNLTGSATVYFENADFLNKFLNETETSLSITLPDGAGNSYIVTIPRLKFTAGQPDTAGQGSITLSMPFQALRDTTTASNIKIRRLPAS